MINYPISFTVSFYFLYIISFNGLHLTTAQQKIIEFITTNKIPMRFYVVFNPPKVDMNFVPFPKPAGIFFGRYPENIPNRYGEPSGAKFYAWKISSVQ